MRQSIVLAVAVCLLAVAVTGTALASGAMRQEADVHRFDTGEAVGDATLTRTGTGVSMTIESSVEGELIELGVPQDREFSLGDATTTWWVVFNNPDGCQAPMPAFGAMCGESDLLGSVFGGDPNQIKADVLFATGHVAGAEWRAGAALKEGATSGSILPGFGLDPIGLMDAGKAEIHLVVRSHGPAKNLVPGELAEAIGSFDGGCGTNACGDPQFAVFPMPTMP